MTDSPARLRRSTEAIIGLLYLCATLQFVRYYSKSTIFYLNMNAYLSGHERLPFQERVLPILFLRPLIHSRWVSEHLVHTNGMYTADRGPLYVISLVSLVVAGVFVQKLYSRVSESQMLRFLVYPLFLFAIMWSYSIHNEANFSYPYDLLGVAFFAAGLYFIYTRRFLYLVLTILLGTFNRETTLFLIGIYILDAASRPIIIIGASVWNRFSFRLVPWVRVAFLGGIWLTIKLALAHHFRHNDGSENYVRIAENVGRLKPRLWPALLNICGYMLPIVVLLRSYLVPARFANYLYILPVWFAVMFYSGVIVETRVYGELCSFVAVAMTIIIERYVQDQSQQLSLQNPPVAEVPKWEDDHETAA